MPGLKALAHMDANQVLNQMTREQLVSLLYEILRRLLSTPQPTHSADVSDPYLPRQEGQLVIDPTIDAWEHSGIYPQGHNPPRTREGGHPGNAQSLLMPQFGSPGLDTATAPAARAVGAIIGGPPCTAFGRPWQPGYSTPLLPVATSEAPQSDDP